MNLKNVSTSLIVERNPNDIIFGYEDPLLSFVASIDPTITNGFYPGIQVNQTNPEEVYQTGLLAKLSKPLPLCALVAQFT